MPRWILCVLATLATLQAGVAYTNSASQYELQLKKLQSRIKQLQERQAGDTSDRRQLQAQLQSAELEIALVSSEIGGLEQQLHTQQNELAELREQREGLLGSRRDQQDAIAQQVNSAYRMGGHSQLKLLLNLEDPALWARTHQYHQYLLDARAQAIDRYLHTVAEIDRLTPRIQERADQLETGQARLLKRQQALQETQGKRQATLASLNASIRDREREIAGLLADRQRLEHLLQEVNRALAEMDIPGMDQPFKSRRGNMPLPAKGKLLHRFGQSRVANRMRWQGITIAARAGTDVSAIHHGRVVFSDYLRGHGLLLILDHGDGYMSLYAHNQALLKETGEWVNAGEVVARVGDSGGQDQSALYFEIRHQGKPLDPTQWCRKA